MEGEGRRKREGHGWEKGSDRFKEEGHGNGEKGGGRIKGGRKDVGRRVGKKVMVKDGEKGEGQGCG